MIWFKGVNIIKEFQKSVRKSGSMIIANKRIKQISSLFFSMVLSLFLGIAISSINTRILTPDQYGDYKFVLAVLNFACPFLTLGFFTSGSRLIAIEKNNKKSKEIIGLLVIINIIIYLLISIGLLIFSFFVDELFNQHISDILLISIPFVFFISSKFFVEKTLIGNNSINLLSLYRILPRIFYLVTAFIIFQLHLKNVKLMLVSYLFWGCFITIFIIYKLKPSFKYFRNIFVNLRSENKTLGFPVYLSFLLNTSTGYFAIFAISLFMTNTEVGFFSLAMTLTMPLTFLPRVIGTTFFKKFSTTNILPRKVQILTIIVSLGSLFVYLLIIKKVFMIIYPAEYLPVIGMVYLLSINSIFRGLGDFYNNFLISIGKGNQIRNSAFILGVINIVGYFILVKYFAINGAIIVTILVSFLYLFFMFYYYLWNKKKYC